MAKDKYTATWVSHTSISDFLNCPKAYYLKNVYKRSETGHKMKLMSPPLALGQAVHEVLESLSVLPTQTRFNDSLIEKFHFVWQKFKGKLGGFISEDAEIKYKQRGEEMLRKIMKNPGPLAHLAVKLKQKLPYFWLSEELNIILCGKLDWLEYIKDSNSIHIIDFKTSKKNENTDSLQLPIYYLLAANCQKRNIAKLSYWYLERNDEPEEIPLPDYSVSFEKVLNIARKVRTARELNVFRCPQGEQGCHHCNPYQNIVDGKAEFIGVSEYKEDIFIMPKQTDEEGSYII